VIERDGWMNDGKPTCALDVADMGENHPDYIAGILPMPPYSARFKHKMSRQAAHKILEKAIRSARSAMLSINEFASMEDMLPED
jgi:hypothetical protein